jgi:hypothetical protein
VTDRRTCSSGCDSTSHFLAINTAFGRKLMSGVTCTARKRCSNALRDELAGDRQPARGDAHTASNEGRPRNAAS